MTVPALSLARRALDLWRGRHAPVIAGVVEADRNLLRDEPALRDLLQEDLHEKVSRRGVEPLGWRLFDLAWSLRNARRALRGEAMAPLPYEEVVDVSMSTEPDGGYYFERGIDLVTIRAERRRAYPRVASAR